MNFSSILFVVYFVPFFFICFYLCPKKYRYLVLLVFSLSFYAYSSLINLGLIILLSLSNYFLAGHLYRNSLFFYIGLFVNLGTLALYKYNANLIMPLGISFFTFNNLMYLIEARNYKFIPEEDVLVYISYATMFPVISMGPLTSYGDIKGVIKNLGCDFEEFYLGLRRFIFGLCIKSIVADKLGLLYNNLKSYENASSLGNLSCLFIYGLYLFLDFSSYCHMAIGLGKMMGMTYRENFDYPYCATTVSQFWRRWHISLTNFFTRYIYIPLGGKRVNTIRHIGNILIVWILTGIWHGSTINYIIWGLYYGLVLILEKYLLADILNKMPQCLRHLYVLSLVYIGYIFFITEDIGGIVLFITGIFNKTILDGACLFYLKENILLIIVATVLCIKPSKRVCSLIDNKAVKWLGDIVLVILFIYSLACILSSDYMPFLYSAF